MNAHEARTAEAQQRAVAEDELARSALRQAEIERRIAEAQQKLKDRELARKGKRGRMTVHEQAIENKLNALLVRLRRGYLPGEVMSTPSAPPAEVFASAQQHVQHHAAGGAAEDVDALMAQGVDASAETLVQVALDRGLYLSSSDAAGFIESVVVEERARALLAERGYHELQQALRLRAPPKPLAPPLTLGVTVGTAALPGPLAPMAAAVRDPAQLSGEEGSDNDDDMPAAGARAPAAPRAPAAAPTATPNPLACARCGRVAGNAGALSTHVQHCGKTGPTRAERQAQAAKERRAKKRAAAGDAAVEPDAPQDE